MTAPMACGTLALRPGIEPVHSAVGESSPLRCLGGQGRGFDPGLPLVRRAPSTSLLWPELGTSWPVGGGCGVARGRREPRGKTGSPAAAQGRVSAESKAGRLASWLLSFLSRSESLWPIEARNAAIANHCFTCAINRVGQVSP